MKPGGSTLNSIDTITKPIVLFVKGEQYFDGVDPDGTELMTDGTMTVSPEGIDLTYEETELTGMAGTTTTFRIRDGRVTLLRTGAVNSQMIFEEGVAHDSLYQMSFGTLMMTVKATFVFFDIVEDGGTIDLSYNIDIENTEAGIIDYHLDIRAK